MLRRTMSAEQHMQDTDQTQELHSMPAHQQPMQDNEQQEDPVSTPTPDAVQFYRTSYKLSEQQIALPKGLYCMRPGTSLAVQLYVAVHPQDWDGDAYVAQRAARLQQLAHPQVGRRGDAIVWNVTPLVGARGVIYLQQLAQKPQPDRSPVALCAATPVSVLTRRHLQASTATQQKKAHLQLPHPKKQQQPQQQPPQKMAVAAAVLTKAAAHRQAPAAPAAAQSQLLPLSTLQQAAPAARRQPVTAAAAWNPSLLLPSPHVSCSSRRSPLPPLLSQSPNKSSNSTSNRTSNNSRTSNRTSRSSSRRRTVQT
jgi:hypothetical protein